MYAIIESGGKQYRVSEGDVIDVELLPAGEGEQVTFDRVLGISDPDGALVVGTPLIPGASVVGKVLSNGKGRKILVFRYRAKSNLRKRRGHRQPFTRVQIEKIVAQA